jgi:glycosyltransferase involved in cell wall biosynthesis
MNISVVIPLLNEVESLPELCSWIVQVMNANKFSYEVIFIDDGSNDGSWEVIAFLCASNPDIKGIRFRRNYGKSAALNVAFEAALGDVVITMDADLQDSPDEIPGMYKMLNEGNYDLLSGWKKKRYDPISKTIPTKFFNSVTRRISGIRLHDFNCGLKAYKKDVIKAIEVYGEMHRYIPVIAKWSGFPRIGERVVQHRERKYGASKFGLERFINGFLDLMTIAFVSKFGKRPMHFFGLIGSLVFFVGFLAATALGLEKLYNVYQHFPARLLTQRPSFFIALTTMVIGTMLFLAGFIGELVSRNSPIRNNYLIEKKIGVN